MNLAIVTMQFYEHYLYWKSGQKGRLLSSFRFLLHCVYTVICSMLVLINLGDQIDGVIEGAATKDDYLDTVMGLKDSGLFHYR